MKFAKEIRLAFSYIKRYRALTILNLFILLTASFFEGMGLGMIIPILQSMEGKSSTNIFTKYAERLCSLMNIEFNFINLIIIFGIIMLTGYGITAFQQYLSRVLSASVTYELRDRSF